MAVEALVVDEGAILNDGDFRELDIDVGVARENCEVVVICGEGVSIGGKLGVWQVVDDDAELRDAFDDVKQSANESRIGICAFEDEPGIGESAEAIEEVRLADVCEQIAVPKVAVADADEERILAKPVELDAIGHVRGIEVAYDSEDEWVGFSDVEKPVVIGKKRTAFDSDAAGDA